MKKYSLIICYFVFFHTVVNALQCVRDKHVTNEETEVDWWISIKMPQYMDLYLYYDSIMDANGETNFKEGYFLRSEDSAFGRALDNLNKDDAGFIAYNDHFVQNEGQYENKRPTKFYDLGRGGFRIDRKTIFKGAHEKGILAWNGNKGLWIQHTFPNFPNCIAPPNKDGPHDISDCPFNVVKGKLDYPKDTMDILRFSYLGWQPRNLFPSNIANDFKDIKGKNRIFIKNPYLRPAQHMVCLSLPTMDDVYLLNKKLSHMLPYKIKDFMKKSSKRKDDIDNQLFNLFAQQPFTSLNQKRHPDLYFQLPINPDKPKYDLMVFNSYVDEEFGCIWNKLVNTDATPTQPYIDGDKEQMYLSTYIPKDPNLKVQHKPDLKEQYKSASYLVNFVKGPQTFYYGVDLDISSDHSKIGFTKEDKHPAKVCFSGGNALEDGVPLRPSSIMICINSGNLRSAFNSILDTEKRPEFNWNLNVLSINGEFDIYADNAINMAEFTYKYPDFMYSINPSPIDFHQSTVSPFLKGNSKIQSKKSNINIVPRALIVREYYTLTIFENLVLPLMKTVDTTKPVSTNIFKRYSRNTAESSSSPSSSSSPIGTTPASDATPTAKGAAAAAETSAQKPKGRFYSQAFDTDAEKVSRDLAGYAKEKIAKTEEEQKDETNENQEPVIKP